jgi:hypothetical protein
MSKRIKRKKISRYHDNDGNLRPLTPIENFALQAFGEHGTDNFFHDAITLASYFAGRQLLPPSHRAALERVANIVLKDLLAMGYLTSDSLGWLRLADNAQDEPQRAPETQGDE